MCVRLAFPLPAPQHRLQPQAQLLRRSYLNYHHFTAARIGQNLTVTTVLIRMQVAFIDSSFQ